MGETRVRAGVCRWFITTGHPAVVSKKEPYPQVSGAKIVVALAHVEFLGQGVGMKPNRAWLAALALVACGVRATAAEVLVPRAVVTSQERPATFDLLITNEGTGALEVAVPDHIAARLQAGSETAETVMLRIVGVAGKRSIAPGGFARVAYTLVLPPGLTGPAVLEPADAEVKPVMFSIEPERIAVAAAAPAQPGPGHPKGAELRRQAALRRSTRLLSGVSAYEPVYFGIGAGGGLNAKFQLSLKYNPFEIWPFYFGYTQTSLWDLHSTSKPFRDTAYRPSLFYLNEDVWTTPDRRFRFGWQGGLGHESNGRGGVDSRSINIAFVRPRFEWRLGGGSRLVVSPKFYGYLEKSENPDIADYRGYCDFLVTYLWHDWRLSVTARRGMRAHYGSIQVDAVFPLRTTEDLVSRVGVRGVNGYLFVQYFNGWGESILDYNRKLHSQVRAGLMLVP